MALINERIKERRVSLGFTLLEIADFLGVKEATAQRYESGAIKSIGHETIIKLSEILNCSPSYLMGWENTAIMHKKDNFLLSDLEKDMFDSFRKLNNAGKQKLLERANELLELGYVEKGEIQKMA